LHTLCLFFICSFGFILTTLLKICKFFLIYFLCFFFFCDSLCKKIFILLPCLSFCKVSSVCNLFGFYAQPLLFLFKYLSFTNVFISICFCKTILIIIFLFNIVICLLWAVRKIKKFALIFLFFFFSVLSVLESPLSIFFLSSHSFTDAISSFLYIIC